MFKLDKKVMKKYQNVNVLVKAKVNQIKVQWKNWKKNSQSFFQEKKHKGNRR